MASLRGYHPRHTKQTNNENLQPHLPSSKPLQSNNNNNTNTNNIPTTTSNNPIPKRALGDITNVVAPTAPVHDPLPQNPFKPTAATKIRRTATAATKLPSSNSAAARRAKANALAAAAKKSLSPMSTSTLATRRTSDRLAKRAAAAVAVAAAAAAVPCKLDFASVAMDESDFVDDNALLFHMVQCPPGVVDIDQHDLEDELANAVYAKDVHANYCTVETKFMPDPDYMARQSDITVKMRAILVDWLVDVHLKFRLQPETLHLTINIVDRYLTVKNVLRRKLQLVGITAMFIASKYQEIYAPEVADFVYISDKAYPQEEILAMEAEILNKLKFEVTVPSGLTFLRRCMKAARVETGYDMQNHVHTALYLIELALQNSAMLRHRPSVRAATACRLAAKLCSLPLVWSDTMSFYSGGWTEEDLAHCEVDFIQILADERDSTRKNKLTAVKRKFGVAAYSCVSRLVCDGLVLLESPTSMEICSAE